MAGKRTDNFGGRVIPIRRKERGAGRVPTNLIGREARLAAIPVARTGRRIAGVGRRLTGRSREEIDHDIRLRTAQHLFEVLGELRGCAAKLGQMIGIYCAAAPRSWAGVISEDFTALAGAALSRLQDSVPPMLPGLVHQVLAANMGPQWRNNFRSFDDRPASAASLGQVHRAVWHDGRAVAVKVMYPGVREAVAADLRMLRGMSAVFGVVLPGADVDAVIAMVCDCVEQELDYRGEAATQQSFADAFADDPEFVVPAVVARTDDVIVGEWLSGTPVTQLLNSEDPRRRLIGFRILRFIATGHRRCGLLYSDVHPGNFLAMPDGRLGVLDFGACGQFPGSFPTILSDIADALYNGTPDDLERVLRHHGFIRPTHDFDAMALAVVAAPFMDVLLQQDFRLSPKWLRKQVAAISAVRLSNVFRQMTLPPELTVVARSVITAAGTMCRLEAEGSVRDEFLGWWPELAHAVHRYEERTATRPAPYPRVVQE